MTRIETDRLVLREWKPDDLPLFRAMNSDSRVMKYFPATLNETETDAFYHRIINEFNTQGHGLYAVELKSTGEFIGFVGLHRIGFEADFTPGIEIGWRLAAEHHNHGYATEAAKAVLETACNAGIRQLYSFTAKNNLPSERVMQKIGMEYAGEFFHPALPATHPLARHVLYRITLGDKAHS